MKQSWTLDSLGNWLDFNDGTTTDTKTFNAANETTEHHAAFGDAQYDAAGNSIVTAKPGDATTALDCVYDAWNRLVSAAYGATTVTYQYDGTGRRTERIVGSTVEHDYYSGQQVVQIYTYSGETFQGGQQYVWSPLYVDTPILRDSYDSDGDLHRGRPSLLHDRREPQRDGGHELQPAWCKSVTPTPPTAR